MRKFREIAIITSSGIRNVNNIRNVYRNKLLTYHETYQTTFRQESVKSNKLRCLLLVSWPIFIFKARLDTSKVKALHRRTPSPDLLHNRGKPGNCQCQAKLCTSYFIIIKELKKMEMKKDENIEKIKYFPQVSF